MKYFLILQQVDEGCDYTIGCGTKCLALKSTSKDMALLEAKNMISNPDMGWLDDEERELKSADVMSFVGSVDLDQARKDLAATKLFAEQMETEEKERQEYLRLKKKFG